MHPAGLYIHIPFCAAICNYCNFTRGLLDEALKRLYVDALVLEIQSGDPTASPLQDVSFFPYDPGLIENASPQKATAQPGPSGTVYQLRIERARMPAGNLTRVYGLLVANGLSRVDGPAAIEVNVPVSRR